MSSPIQPHMPLLSSDTEEEADTSPLGDYLADVESSFDALGPPFDPTLTYEDATITRRRRPRKSTSPLRRAQSPQPLASVATRSVSPDNVPEAGPSRIPMESPTRHVDDAFAERFKYLIATSGLLEKTQLDRSSRRTDSEGGSPPVSPTHLNHAPSVAGSQTSTIAKPSAESKWNVLAAVGAVVIGLAYVLGPSTVVTPTALAAGFVLLKPQKPNDSESDEEEDEDEDPVAGISPSTPDSVYQSLPSSPVVEESEQAPTDRVFKALESLLAESRNMDQTIKSALQILAPHPDDTSYAHELRIALHRLMDDMTDSLATCTSTLISMADRTELSVLGELYDIPVLGPRRGRRHSSADPEDAERLRPRRSSFGSDPVALREFTPSPFDPNDKFTKLPDRTSRQRRSGLSADWTSPPSAYRPPPHERIPESNDEETGSESMMSQSSNESSFPASLPEITGPISPSRNRHRAFAPKRASPLAQTLERLEGTPSVSPPFPVLQNRVSSGSSYRRSLQDIRYIPSSPPSSSEAAANLALARASANLSSANRRSLQMPLKPNDYEVLEQAIAAAGANLHRARSLPQSQRASLGLRPLTTALSPDSTGSIVSERSTSATRRLSSLSDRAVTPTHHSSSSTSSPYRRTSLLFADAGLSPQNIPRPSRITSVSPLTLGGLKAAYLGVHLKRRRAACCLLGLRFCVSHDVDEEYWTGVCEALRVLGDSMAAGRERLEVALGEAEKEIRAARIMSTISSTSPVHRNSPLSPTLVTQPPTDFAPRDTTEQALLANVDELQRTLARVWARCDEMRTRVASGDGDTLDDSWSEVRTEIGGLLRHVERGRELARRDERDSAIDEEDETETSTSTPPLPIPDFIRAWADPGPEELERPVLDDIADEDVDALPPPGIDEVYEAEIPAAATVRPKSALSRDERIALQREARAKGMTLAQLMAGPEEQEKERLRELQRQRMLQESAMISELESMFGAIRRRKGMVEE